MMGSRLKDMVQERLKPMKRSMSWLSEEMGMTPDGLRLSLINETIKYSSIVRLCGILGVRVSELFGEEPAEVVCEKVKHDEIASIPRNDDRTKDSEVVRLLKGQIKDKQLIIDLLMRERKGVGDDK